MRAARLRDDSIGTNYLKIPIIAMKLSRNDDFVTFEHALRSERCLALAQVDIWPCDP
jgi:hypothetical protein